MISWFFEWIQDRYDSLIMIGHFIKCFLLCIYLIDIFSIIIIVFISIFFIVFFFNEVFIRWLSFTMICQLKSSWLIWTRLIWRMLIVLNILTRLIIMFSILVLKIVDVVRDDLQRLAIRNLRRWRYIYVDIVRARQIQLIWLIKLIVSILILIRIERIIRRLRLLKLTVWTKWATIKSIILLARLVLLHRLWQSGRFGTVIVLIELDLFHILHVFNEERHCCQGAKLLNTFTETKIKSISHLHKLSWCVDHIDILCMTYNVQNKVWEFLIILYILNDILLHFKHLHCIQLSAFKPSE